MVKYGSANCKKHAQKVVLGVVATTIVLIMLVVATGYGIGAMRAEAVGGSSYIVIEATSGRILKGSNVTARLPMASTTKAMTAIVAIEHADINDEVIVPKCAVGIEGSSIYLKEGEKFTLKELLYGLMLRSGNDSAVAIATHVGGSVEGFVEMMNDKVSELGLTNTHFVNPHGLSAKDHYTSAYDLAMISAYAMNNPVFKEIVSTKAITIKRDGEDETRYFANKNRILYSYEGANGVKTGYTKEAGRCLIASSERDGMQVIAVALNVYDYFNVCAELMDYAHENYRMVKVADKTKPVCEIKVKQTFFSGKAEVFVKEDRYYPLKKDGSEVVTTNVDVVESVKAPYSGDESVGEVKIFADNRLIFTEKLYTIYNIEKKIFPF